MMRYAEKPQFGYQNRLFLELVVPNAVVTRDDHPTVQSRCAQPGDVVCTLRKELVMNPDFDTSSAQGQGHLLPAQGPIDEERESLRRLVPAGARSGPLLRC